MDNKKQKLPPWVTIDENGAHHFDIPMLMKDAGIPDNPHNREMATQAAAEILKGFYPDTPQTIV